MTKLSASILSIGATAATVYALVLVLGSADEDVGRDVIPSDAGSTKSHRPSSRASAEEPAPTRAVVSDVRQRQAVLAHEVDDLRRQLAQIHESGAPSPQVTTPVVADEPEIDGNEHAREVADGFEQSLGEQPVDVEWAEGMQARFDQFFATEQVAGSHVGAVDCRSTLCRIEVSFDDQGGRDALIGEVSGLLEPNAQGFAHIEDDEDLEIQVYLSRQDTMLPVEG